jgi:hypothetical protein
MKPKLTPLIAWVACSLASHALEIPGATGLDGDFSPTAPETIIDLGLAKTATWDAIPDVAGSGVYDPAQWAVVFKFNSVNIPAGVTVRFVNHVSHAPVVWIVSGDVNISGNIVLDGQSGSIDGLTQPGPGGFRGGRGSRDESEVGSGGFGPGGGNLGYEPINQSLSGEWNAGGFGTAGLGTNPEKRGKTYGNASIRPLIGGSGAGGVSNRNEPGGAGGGAILIAASGSINVLGTISAQGGISGGGAGGSGGAVRIIAERIVGNGRILARGGQSPHSPFVTGGLGRIRLETKSYAGQLTVVPVTPVVAPEPVQLWPDPAAPAARIVSVAGSAVPSTINGQLGPEPADVTVAGKSGGDIIVETENMEVTNANVVVRIVPRNGPAFELPAAFQSGTKAKAIWLASTNFPEGFCALQVRAVVP